MSQVSHTCSCETLWMEKYVPLAIWIIAFHYISIILGGQTFPLSVSAIKLHLLSCGCATHSSQISWHMGTRNEAASPARRCLDEGWGTQRGMLQWQIVDRRVRIRPALARDWSGVTRAIELLRASEDGSSGEADTSVKLDCVTPPARGNKLTNLLWAVWG